MTSTTSTTLAPVQQSEGLLTLTVKDGRRTDWTKAEIVREAKAGLKAESLLLKADGMLTAHRAIMAHGAMLSGLVGRGDSAVWATWKDYAAATGGVKKDGTPGISEGYLSKVRLYGRALVEHGVKVNSPEWTAITEASGGHKGIVSAIRGEDRAALKSAVSDYKAEAAVKAEKAATRAANGSNVGGSTVVVDAPGSPADPQGEETPRAPRTLGDARALIRELHSLTASLSESSQRKVIEALTAEVKVIGERLAVIGSDVEDVEDVETTEDVEAE